MFAYTSIKINDKKKLVDKTILAVTVVKLLQASVAVVKSSFKYSLGKEDFDTFTLNAFERSTQRLILLLLSGIETNPGPRRPRFPCTICQKACKIESIACDDCDKWTHRNCIGMSTSEYSNLGKSEDTWTCPSCCKPNNSSTKIYFIPNGDDSKHSTQNISTNPLMMDSISEASIPSTSDSALIHHHLTQHLSALIYRS
ncbi:unnamed protein product [Mytilus edulis]|uniref:PHD-type domain-containing protein n=1 Tax=Mytilus edulis TaxID=6550 RepID=A0A8S3SRE7_MYTED|nr:unnamed protein product [Mytilus edulis]